MTQFLFFQVIFVKKLEPFATIASQQFQCEKKYDIYFSDGKIYAQFRYEQLKIVCFDCFKLNQMPLITDFPVE